MAPPPGERPERSGGSIFRRRKFWLRAIIALLVLWVVYLIAVPFFAWQKVDKVELRRRIGYVIQQVGLFPHQTVATNVATVPRLLGWDKARVAFEAILKMPADPLSRAVALHGLGKMTIHDGEFLKGLHLMEDASDVFPLALTYRNLAVYWHSEGDRVKADADGKPPFGPSPPVLPRAC